MREHERTDMRFMRVILLSNDVGDVLDATNSVDQIIKTIGAGIHDSFGAE